MIFFKKIGVFSHRAVILEIDTHEHVTVKICFSTLTIDFSRSEPMSFVVVLLFSFRFPEVKSFTDGLIKPISV